MAKKTTRESKGTMGYLSSSALATLVAKDLKGKRQFCVVIGLDENEVVIQKNKYEKKQVPGKLHVEDFLFSSDKLVLKDGVKTLIIGSINSFCLSGNSQRSERPCCMDILSEWHRNNQKVRLLLVFKKLYEVDKRIINKKGSFEKYLAFYFHSKFSQDADLLRWNREIALVL
jgi:hypothetical protein